MPAPGASRCDSITTVVEIRDAQPGDAHSIATVHVQSWQVAYHGLLPESVLASLSVPDRERTWLKIFLDPPPRTVVLLATCEAAVVGFVAVGPAKTLRLHHRRESCTQFTCGLISGDADSGRNCTAPPSTA